MKIKSKFKVDRTKQFHKLKNDLFREMIQYNLVKDEYNPDIFKIEGHERPPII